MKTNYIASIVAAFFSLTAFTLIAWAGLSAPANATVSFAIEGSGGPARFAGVETVATAEGPTAAAPNVATDLWNNIKDCSFEERDRFFAGLRRMEDKVDGQIGELAAKRATMTGSTNTKDWDFAMKEMQDARSYLASVGREAGKASPETWDQQKEKVGQAWVRAQEAYNKVKGSTTS